MSKTDMHDPENPLLTHRDLDDMPDDRNRYEVIDGELYISPGPMTAHQEAVMQLLGVVGNHVRVRNGGKVYLSVKVVLDEHTGVLPDVVFIAKSQLAELREDGHYGPPELVIEVLGLDRRLDIKVKRAAYARAGILHYWIVGPEEQTLWEYCLENGAYVLRATPSGEDEFRPQLFPGLVIPLGRLWDAPIRLSQPVRFTRGWSDVAGSSERSRHSHRGGRAGAQHARERAEMSGICAIAPRRGGAILFIMATDLRDPEESFLTHRELEDLPDDGNRYEIIDGELYVTPFPLTGHQRAVAELARLLGNHVVAEDLGEVFAAGLKVVLDDASSVGPDVVFLSKSQAKRLERDGYYGPPEMVVEVLSWHRNLDIKVKRARYARAGIPYYWIVDTIKRTLWEFRLENGVYVLQAQPTGDDEFRPQLFPGLVLPLSRLWGTPLPP